MPRDNSRNHTGLILLLVIVAITGCGFDGPVMSVDALNATLSDPARKITVIDVRPRVQFNRGHVPGATNYPLEEIDQSLKTISSTKAEVAIICTCGRRSLAAIKQLAAKGITTTLVEGGMKKWEAQGYSTVKEN